jgi:hypothetical protein
MSFSDDERIDAACYTMIFACALIRITSGNDPVVKCSQLRGEAQYWDGVTEEETNDSN